MILNFILAVWAAGTLSFAVDIAIPYTQARLTSRKAKAPTVPR